MVDDRGGGSVHLERPPCPLLWHGNRGGGGVWGSFRGVYGINRCQASYCSQSVRNIRNPVSFSHCHFIVLMF